MRFDPRAWALLAALCGCDGTRGPLFASVATDAAPALPPDAGPDIDASASGNDAGGGALGPSNAALVQFGGTIFSGVQGLETLRQNLAAIESGPFDGLVVDLGMPSLFSGTKVARADFEPALAAWQRARSPKLDANFQRMQTSPADFFDDGAFANAAANAGVVAAVLKEGGLRGLLLDLQSYGARVLAMPADPKGRSFADHEARVRQRGRELGGALMDAYPDITLLLTLGYTEPFRAACLAGEPFATGRYALLPAFVDGLTEARAARGNRAVIVDAFLSAYATRDERSFRVFRDLIHFRWQSAASHWFPDIVTYTFPESGDAWSGAFTWPAAPRLLCSDADRDRFARDLQAGYGLMLDYEHDKRGGFRTDAADFSANHHTPESFERTLTAALRAADGYAWIWTSTLDFWTFPGARTPVPAAYVDAIRRAKAAAKAP